YAVVSRQFDIPTSENIFIGKLPVYMFNRFADFKKFAQEDDDLNLHDAVHGDFAGRDDGGGHLAMRKPTPSRNGRPSDPEEEGADPESALEQVYGWNDKGLERAWRAELKCR